MAKSLIPIVDIANNICEDVGDHTKKHQRFVLRHLARCFQKLHLFMTPVTTVKTIVCPISNIIEMPSDFIYETKVGIRTNGKIVLIKRNYDDVGNVSANEVNQSGFNQYVIDVLGADINECVTPFYNYKGELVLSAYGYGSVCDGLYTVDNNNGRINIGSVLPKNCEIVIEYKSDGVSDGLKLVPTEMESCLYNYGLSKYYFSKADPRYKQSEIDYDGDYFRLESIYRFYPIDYISKLYNQEKGTINGLL